jgi:hypothetical protein
MPAKSEKQKKFMQVVLAYKQKKLKPDEVSKNVKQAAGGMTVDQIEDFIKEYTMLNEAESTISTIKKVKGKTFSELLDENNGVPFDEKELFVLQTKQTGFSGIGRTKFTLNKKTNEIKAEIFTNRKNKRCVIKKLIDVDAKNLYNYALFVEIVDANNKSEDMFYMLSSNFNDENSFKTKTLTDFINRFNSYGI